jgi:glucosamine-6-phosphate deaminase
VKVEVLADADAVAARAAATVCDAVRSKPVAVLGLPTGNTPIATYAVIARRVAAGAADFTSTSVYALDEVVGPVAGAPGTNGAFYGQSIRFPVGGLHVPDPAAADPEQHIRSHADALRRAGGFDVCVLGIGVNGHIAFNEPGSGRDSAARVVALDESTRVALAGAFGSLADVPQEGMTLGVADLLESRRVLVLALGEHKAEAVRRAIEAPPSASTPASWLQGHDDVTWLLDTAAASPLRRG